MNLRRRRLPPLTEYPRYATDRLHTFLVFLVFLLTQCSNHMVRCVITDVRLTGGPTYNKGTIEIRIDNGTWETTCGTNIDAVDVIVICRHLRFKGASIAIKSSPYGQNSTPSRGLGCNGGEADLSKCTLQPSPGCFTAGGASCHGRDYLGCFVDLPNNRVLSGDESIKYTNTHMTISYCIQFCKESTATNYTYAGVEDVDQCFCGEASDNYTIHGVGLDANCQSPCSGDPTDSCGGIGYIAVFTIQVETAETTTAVVSTEKVNEVTTQVSLIASQPSLWMTSNTKDAVTSSTMTTSLQTPTTLQQSCNCSYVASTLAVGILLALATLYGIIITLMYIHIRRSKIALKPSVSDREGQDLDPYTSLDAKSMKQTAYEDIKATRHGNRGHTNAIEGVEYENQTIVKQTARVKKSNLGVADENIEPDYELPVVK